MLSGSHKRSGLGGRQAAWLVPPVLIVSIAAIFPPGVQLPALSLLSLTGALVAVLLSAKGGTPRRLMLRDMAGLLAFLGFSAALVSDGADTLRLFDQSRG